MKLTQFELKKYEAKDLSANKRVKGVYLLQYL